MTSLSSKGGAHLASPVLLNIDTLTISACINSSAVGCFYVVMFLGMSASSGGFIFSLKSEGKFGCEDKHFFLTSCLS